MRKFIAAATLIAAAMQANGKSVDVVTAQSVAFNYLQQKTHVQGSTDLSLAYTATSQINGQTVADFYIFNRASTPGFVIVSADDNVLPVLGYSTESQFITDKSNASVDYWLNGYKDQINYVIANGITASGDISARWFDLAGRTNKTASRTTTTAVLAMLKTKWDQFNEYGATLTYNADCPYDSYASPASQTVTGCVATAMAQVMKYWNWPDTGVGNHSYTPPSDDLPMQTANFAVPFNFDSMQVPYVNRSSASVAQLMFFAGVSVNMGYGTADEGGSGSYVTEAYSPITNCAEYALKTYFKYPTAKGYQKRSFSQAQWIDSMSKEMYAGRPVIYAGKGSAGGHCWVMDGYDGDSMFHFNWGWSGNSNGFFTLNDLAPNDTFNSGQEAIVRIEVDTAHAPVDTIARTRINNINSVTNGIQVFPNPASDQISVVCNAAIKNVLITDVSGKTLESTTPGGSDKKITVPVEGLANGVYFIRVASEDGVQTAKFVIAR